MVDYNFLVAFDPKHLPKDPQALQQIVFDLIVQLERDLLDAKRNRKSEQLSADQLALFAAVWDAWQAEACMDWFAINWSRAIEWPLILVHQSNANQTQRIAVSARRLKPNRTH